MGCSGSKPASVSNQSSNAVDSDARDNNVNFSSAVEGNQNKSNVNHQDRNTSTNPATKAAPADTAAPRENSKSPSPVPTPPATSTSTDKVKPPSEKSPLGAETDQPPNPSLVLVASSESVSRRKTEGTPVEEKVSPVQDPESRVKSEVPKTSLLNTASAEVSTGATRSSEEQPPSSGDQSSSAVPSSEMASATAAKAAEADEVMEVPAQVKFDTVLRLCSDLVKGDSLLKQASPQVQKLHLLRAPPRHLSLQELLKKLSSLMILDVSRNNLGPQAFRAVCLAMCSNTSILSLNLGYNGTDTDSAEAVGRLVKENGTLEYLDVSSNTLGKDFFSRCVGEALKTNTSLRTLRAESVGMVDVGVLLEGLAANSTLTDLNLSSNEITDRTALGRGLAACLKKADCKLTSLALSGCNISPEGFEELLPGLAANKSLEELNLSNNEIGSVTLLTKFVACAIQHPALRLFNMVNSRLSDADVSEADIKGSKPAAPSPLRVLSLSSCQLKVKVFSVLAALFPGTLTSLRELDVTDNTLVPNALKELHKLTADSSGKSALRKLNYSMNDAKVLCDILTPDLFPGLEYLNLRKVRAVASALTKLMTAVTVPSLSIGTLVLDSLKLAGTEVLSTLCGSLSKSKVTALSLSSCSLADSDLSPLTSALKQGAGLVMLKLSANRLKDPSLEALTQALMANKTHPLAVLDLSDNEFGDQGAECLARLYSGKGHNSSLHSVNLRNNHLGKAGLLTLVGLVGGKSPLQSLYLSSQSGCSLDEAEAEELYTKLASSMGFKLSKSGGTIPPNSCDLPALPDNFTIHLVGLGGQTGEVGRLLDCPAIMTDAASHRLHSLSLSHVLDIGAILKGQDKGPCVLSSNDWGLLTNSHRDREIPSWVQLEDHRTRAIYVSNLPGSATVQKLEAIFDSEADCTVEEVVLTKDPVTRQNSGQAWILMKDATSVQKAVDFFYQGEAKIFGTPFMVSTINVKIDDAADSEAVAKARRDMEERRKQRRADDTAHRRLIQQSAEESWKRHAYRLAHPAYADGRIW